MSAAARSAIANTVAWLFAEAGVGMMEASATRRREMPRTRSFGRRPRGRPCAGRHQEDDLAASGGESAGAVLDARTDAVVDGEAPIL